MLRILLLLPFIFFFGKVSYASGFILVSPSQHQHPNLLHSTKHNGGFFPLESVSMQVNCSLRALSATTNIKQVFFNPSKQQLEGYFLFPVPKDVVINQFSMDINGVKHHAELLDAQKARKIYEDIVRQSKDPALLEFYGKRLFRVRVFPILAQKELNIELTYTQSVASNNGTHVYSFPLRTDKYAAKGSNSVSFRIEIKTKDKLKSVYCPTHAVEINRKGAQTAVVGYETTKAACNRDFKLYFNSNHQEVGVSVLNYKNPKEAGYFLMNISPGLDEKQAIIAKDIIFVLDKSGSMAGKKIQQAKKALQFCIENLNKEDRFEIIPFSTEASSLFGTLKKMNPTHKREAIQYLESIQPIGGTNVEEALERALKSRTEPSDRPLSIIFLTDGKPTIGLSEEAALVEKIKQLNQHKVRIFTFGIGTQLNTHLLDKITHDSRAYRSYVLPDEDIELKVSDFYTKVAAPVMTNVQIEFDKNIAVFEVYDKTIPDLFKGSSISLMGRYQGTGNTTVTLTGLVNGHQKKYTYTVSLEDSSSKASFIPKLWASRAVGYLLDQIRLHGSKEELIAEVTRLAKKHGIITPYTSYLILEDETVAAQNGQSIQHQILRPRAQNAPNMIEEIDFEEEVANVSGANKGQKIKKSGRISVEISKEYQRLNLANNLSDAKQGTLRMNYTDQTGQGRNLADDIVNIQGRAFYNNNNNWIDANIALEQPKSKPTERILFNSKAYHELTKQVDALAFLNLGKNIRFVLNNRIYEIYDKS
jgi:Ca-activated chloride channel family protein